MRAITGFLCLSLLAAAAAPQTPPETLDEVLVTGEYPGPGLWKVTRPDDADHHVLYIVGDPSPLPKGMKWKSKEIESAAGVAQEILSDYNLSIQADEKIGVFRALTLLPAALRARKNPDDQKLEDLLPADLHARWLVQKRLYLGRESGIERWRPLFAAEKLRQAAFEELGLSEGGVVSNVVMALAQAKGIRVTSPTLAYTFKRSEVRERIKRFLKESLADRECLATTVELTEALARKDVVMARARAWATGDLEALTSLPAIPNTDLPCTTAVLNALVSQNLVPADLFERAQAVWIEAAEKGLAHNQTTFAVVPFPTLTRADGYLARLEAKGYLIEAPQ